MTVKDRLKKAAQETARKAQARTTAKPAQPTQRNNVKSTDTKRNQQKTSVSARAGQTARNVTQKVKKGGSASPRTVGKQTAKKITNSKQGQQGKKVGAALQRTLDQTRATRDLVARQNVRAESHVKRYGTLPTDAPFVKQPVSAKRLAKTRSGAQILADAAMNLRLSGEDKLGKVTMGDYVKSTNLSPLEAMTADSRSQAHYGRNAGAEIKKRDLTDKEKVQEAKEAIHQAVHRGGARQQPLSKWDKKLKDQVREEIGLAKQDYVAAERKGDKGGMTAAHNRAEDMRRIFGGFSGGQYGSEHITPDISEEDRRNLNDEGLRQLAAAKLGWEKAQSDEDRKRYAALGESVRRNPTYKREHYDPGAYRETDANGRMRYAGTKEERRQEGERLGAIPGAIGYETAGAFASIPEVTARALQADAARNQALLRQVSEARGGGDVSVSEPEAPEEETLGQRLLRKGQEYRERATEGEKGLDRYLTEALITGGEMVPGLLASALTGGTAAPGLAVMGAQAAGQKMGDLNARGVDPVEAFNRGLVAGAIESAAELIPLRNLLKTAKGGGKSFARNLLTQVAEETGTEEISELGNYAADKAFRDPNASLTGQDLIDTAAISALTSLGLGAGAGALGASGVRRARTAGADSGLTGNEDPAGSRVPDIMDNIIPSAEELAQREQDLKQQKALWIMQTRRTVERLKESVQDPAWHKHLLDELAQQEAQGEQLKQQTIGLEMMKAEREEADRQLAERAETAQAQAIQELEGQEERPALSSSEQAPQVARQEPIPLPESAPVEEQGTEPVQQEMPAEAQETPTETSQGERVHSAQYGEEANHIDNRNSFDVASRKVKAFQWDYPEVKPFFRGMAEALKRETEIAFSQKEYVRGSKARARSGKKSGTIVPRNEPLKRLHEMGLSSTDIIKACDAIINDEGQENYAAAKRVELVLDEMLSRGYVPVEAARDPDAMIEPNESYLQTKENIFGAVKRGSFEEYLRRNSLALELGEVTEDELFEEWKEKQNQESEPADGAQVSDFSAEREQQDFYTKRERYQEAGYDWDAEEQDVQRPAENRVKRETQEEEHPASGVDVELSEERKNAPGLDWSDEYVQSLDPDTAREIDAMARALGVSVRFANEVYGGRANANIENGVVTVSRDIDDPIRAIVGHEFTHRLQEIAPAEYQRLRDYVMSRDVYRNAAQEWIDGYARQGVTLSPEEAMDEITADFAGMLMQDENVIADFIQQNRSNPGLLQRVLEILRSFADKLTGRARVQTSKAVRLLEDALYKANERVNEKSNIFSGDSSENVRYSIRREEPPKKAGTAYKVFYAKNGQLYPPMVANPGGEGTPVGVWLNADVGQQAAPSKSGRPQVKSGGKGTQGGSGSLAFRPGWHLGDIPHATQFARLNPETGKKELFPANFVWAECEYAADTDYQDEAMSYGYTENGKFRHSYAGLPRLPENGYYRYRTNPKPDTVPWIITGAMKVKRILTDEETDAICRENGVEPMARQGGPLTAERMRQELGIEAGETNSAYSMKGVGSYEQMRQMQGLPRWGQAESHDRYSVGAAPGGFDPFSRMANEYGTIEPGENPARIVDVPLSTNGTDRVRRFVRTAMEAEVTPDEAVEAFEQDVANGLFSYSVKKDADAFAAAVNTIEQKGYDGALQQWQDVVDGNRIAGKDDIVLAQMLYSLAAQNKDIETARRLAAEIAAEGTVAGQKVQALRLLKKATPEGKLYYIRKIVGKLQDDLNKRRGNKAPKLDIDPELEEQLLGAETDEDQQDALDDIYDHVAKQIPATFADRLNAWRYFAMLGNPRTHIRNIVGNIVVQAPLQVSNKASALVQAALPMEKRTRALVSSRAARQFARADYKEMRDILSGDKYISEKGEIMRRQKLFPAPLQATMDFNSKALEWEDMFFKKRVYIQSLASFLTARGWNPENLNEAQLEQARTHAIKDALHATFQESSALADWLAKVENKNAATKIAVGGLVPFKRVPINIAKMAFNLSPAGLIKAVSYDAAQVKKGNMDATDMIDHLTRGMTGTAVAGLGFFLAAQGLLTASGSDDDKERYFDMAQGSQDYALNLGDISYTIDWAAPSAIPLFLGAEYYNARKKWGEESEDENKAFKDGLESLTRLFDPMLNMTVLSGLSDTLKTVSYSKTNAIFPLAFGIGQNYAGQFVPTLSGQIARTADDTRRTTFIERESPVPNSIQRFIQRQENKIPGLSKRNLPYLDSWGREEKTTSPILRAFENFLSPGYVSKKNTDAVDEELRRLHELGYDGVLPSKAQTNTKVNDKYLTKDEYQRLVQTQGNVARSMLANVIGTPEYQELTDDEKADYVKKIFDFSKQIGKMAVGMPEEKADSYVRKAKEGEDTLDLDPAKYLAMAALKSSIDKDDTTDDKTMKAIDFSIAVDARQDMTDEQKQFIKDNIKFFNMFPVSTAGFEKGIAAGLTEDESKDMLSLKKGADTDGNGSYTNQELYEAINNSELSEEKKAQYWEAMKPSNSKKSWADVQKEGKQAAATKEKWASSVGNVSQEVIDTFNQNVNNAGGYNSMGYDDFFDLMDSMGVPESQRSGYYAIVQSNKGHPWKKTYAEAKKYKGR